MRSEPQDGSRIINQYRMLDVIGQGAYGTVHRAVLVHGGEDGVEFVSSSRRWQSSCCAAHRSEQTPRTTHRLSKNLAKRDCAKITAPPTCANRSDGVVVAHEAGSQPDLLHAKVRKAKATSIRIHFILSDMRSLSSKSCVTPTSSSSSKYLTTLVRTACTWSLNVASELQVAFGPCRQRACAKHPRKSINGEGSPRGLC